MKGSNLPPAFFCAKNKDWLQRPCAKQNLKESFTSLYRYGCKNTHTEFSAKQPHLQEAYTCVPFSDLILTEGRDKQEHSFHRPYLHPSGISWWAPRHIKYVKQVKCLRKGKNVGNFHCHIVVPRRHIHTFPISEFLTFGTDGFGAIIHVVRGYLNVMGCLAIPPSNHP